MGSEAKPRILLVDDEQDILYVCEKALEKLYSVTSFSDPEQALEHFKKHSMEFDMVLTDVRMPNLSGFELARQIRELRSDITIIFMSAFEISNSKFEEVFPSDSVTKFISKPFTLSRLTQFVIEQTS